MGALKETINTLKKLRSSFMKMFNKFKSSYMYLDNPRVTEDGYCISDIRPLDRNHRKLNVDDRYIFRVKYLETDRGFEDIQFIPSQAASDRPSRTIPGPLTMDKLEKEFVKYRDEYFGDMTLSDLWDTYGN